MRQKRASLPYTLLGQVLAYGALALKPEIVLLRISGMDRPEYLKN